jgi:cytochrome c556
MHRLPRVLAPAIVAAMLLTTGARADGADDGKKAFELREQTMKQMGRALYGTVGRVVKGRAEPGPDTTAAAETIVTLAATVGGLFPPGSEVGESAMKPDIFAAKPRVDALVHDVRAAADRLLPATRSGDKAAIADAYRAVNDACDACHREFRKPVE